MHEASCFSTADGVGNELGRDGCGERQVSTRQGFADAHDVRFHTGMFPGKELSGTAKASGNLVEDEQHVVTLTEFTGPY